MTNATLAVPSVSSARRRFRAGWAPPAVAVPRPAAERPVVVANAHEDSRAMYAMILRHAGFRVLEADSGEEVVRLAHACHPRAIVMSAALRGVHGLRALEVLAGDPDTRHIPVVMLNAVGAEEHEQRARAAGCAAYLLVPCLPRTLLDQVRAVTAEPAARG